MSDNFDDKYQPFLKFSSTGIENFFDFFLIRKFSSKVEYTITDHDNNMILRGEKSFRRHLIIWIIGLLPLIGENLGVKFFFLQGFGGIFLISVITFYYFILKRYLLLDRRFWNSLDQYMGKIQELSYKGLYEILDGNNNVLGSLKFNPFGYKRFLELKTSDGRLFTTDYGYELKQPSAVNHTAAYRDLHSQIKLEASAQQTIAVVNTGLNTRLSHKIENNVVEIYQTRVPNDEFLFTLTALCMLIHIKKQLFNEFILSPKEGFESKPQVVWKKYQDLPLIVQFMGFPLIVSILPSIIFLKVIRFMQIGRLVKHIYYSIRSSSWPTEEGKIVGTTVTRDSEATRTSIYFQYTVNSEIYTSNLRRFKGEWIGDSEAHSRKIIEKYPLDKTVTVYYSPTNPEIAVIEPGTNFTIIFWPLIWISIWFSLIVLIFLIFQLGLWLIIVSLFVSI